MTIGDLSYFKIESLRLAGLTSVIARRWGTTYVFRQQADGRWFATKLRGGKRIEEGEIDKLPTVVQRKIPLSHHRRPST